jgi:hypothetical protein
MPHTSGGKKFNIKVVAPGKGFLLYVPIVKGETVAEIKRSYIHPFMMGPIPPTMGSSCILIISYMPIS